MKTVREIQYDKVREGYQTICKAEGRTPDLTDIKNLALQTIYSTDRTPMAGNYRLPSHDKVHLPSLNAELSMIKADAETLGTFFDALQLELRSIKFTAGVWDSYAKAKIQAAFMAGVKLAAPVFIQGFTEQLKPSEYADPNNTTANIGSDETIGLPMVAGSSSSYVHSARDISIQRIGENLEVSLQGDPLGVVNQMPFAGLLMQLSGHVIEEAGFRVIVNTDMKDVNYVAVRLAEETTGIKVRIQVTANRKDYKTIYEGLTKWERIEVPIETMNISQIVVEFTMNTPNLVFPDHVTYEFKLYKIAMVRASRRTSATFQTKQLDIESDVSFVSIAAEEELVGNGSISYSIARTADTEGNPTGFSPVNMREGQLIEMGNVISMVDVVPPDENPRWTVKPERRYGSTLYNILNCGMSLSEGDLTIQSGVLTCSGVVDDGIKLYRGVNDWSRQSRSVSVDRHVESLSYETEIDSQTAWVKPVQLLTTVKHLIESDHISSSGELTLNRVALTYPLRNIEELRVSYDDGTEYYVPVVDASQVNNVWYVTFGLPVGATSTEVFDPSQHYYISHVTTLTDYASIAQVEVVLDLESIEITQGGQQYSHGTDYQIYQSSFMIEFFKTGKYYKAFNKETSTSWISGDSQYTNKSPAVDIKYRFAEVSAIAVEYFETNIYVTSPIDITLIPFTETDKSMGNFHKIDNIDVSSLTSFPLENGWHTLQSTNPYPSVNEYDINSLTQDRCYAGMIIPAAIDTMRIFRDPMRRVSPFVLASLPADEASKCFAFVDGKVLLSAQPDFVDDEIVYDPNMSYAKGSLLICKKPIMEADLSNSGYIPAPEQFQMEVKYQLSEGSSRPLWIRIELLVEDTTSVAKIRQFGLNKFREVV